MVNDYGGFPVLDPNWDPSTFDLTEIIAKLIREMTWSVLMLMNINVYLPHEDNAVYGINVITIYGSINSCLETVGVNGVFSKRTEMNLCLICFI